MAADSFAVQAVPSGSLQVAHSDGDARTRRFERLIVPHLDNAHNLARWLLRNDIDAEDIVQEACLRAFKYLDGFEGGDPTGWLLAIVRNTSFSWIRRKRRRQAMTGSDSVDEETVDGEASVLGEGSQAFTRDPETLLIERRDRLRLSELIDRLPLEYREMIMLRDVEDLSYREIAALVGIPIGTVMSRLCRARRLLQERWLGARERHEARQGR